MKIYLELYNPDWDLYFIHLKKELENSLQGLKPVIEHIGSTSIRGLTSKPIIDVLVGVNEEQLDMTVQPMTSNGFIYYEKFNSLMPYRRFFVKLKSNPDFLIPSVFSANDDIPNELIEHKFAHVHILTFNSYHWIRHIAFREFIKSNLELQKEYERLKIRLASLEWQDENEYNSAKNDFIKQTQARAIEWYNNKNISS